MDFVFIAYHREHEAPIAASHDWDKLVQLIMDYFGPEVKQITWKATPSNFPTRYQGYFQFEDEDNDIGTVMVYETDFR